MNICISEFTYTAFKERLNKDLAGHSIVLIDEKGMLKESVQPDALFLSYEVMFKALADEEYKLNLMNALESCTFVQGSWAGTESEFAQEIISKVKTFSIGNENKDYDESKYAKEVAKYLNTDHEELIISDKKID